jgi:SAM-dependent methyltransferase
MKSTILFLTHRKKQCGVYEFGLNTYHAISKSQKYSFVHAACESEVELHKAIQDHQPSIIIYNYHPAVMPWLCTKVAKGVYKNNFAGLNVTQVGIIHEATQEVADTATAYRNKFILGGSEKRINALFDYYVAADPTLLLKNPFVFKTGRLIPAYENNKPLPTIPTIGSFGFATPNKGFVKLVNKVKQDFKEAVVRLNIPYAAFGDKEGKNASAIAEQCKKVVNGTNIKLEITHDFMDHAQLLDFLASNSMNVFMYEDKSGRGISSAVDFALAVKRPVAVSDCPMFRHILRNHPEVCCDKNSLATILSNGYSGLEKTCASWNEENLIWEYERIVKIILDRKSTYFDAPKMGVIRTIKSWVNKYLTLPAPTFTWLGNTVAATDDVLLKDDSASYKPVELGTSDGFNRILDNQARKLYAPTIDKLFQFAPATMAKKIAEANVQQAFVFDTVYRHLDHYTNPKLLCVGSYEDTASMGLQKLGCSVEEIDPMINYYLQDYISKPTTLKNHFDIIFSTSVIEHDPDDKSFLECIEQLLAPGGMAVITCDYKDGWKPGQPKPEVDARFYTKEDMQNRMLSYMPQCELVDAGNWDCPNPDFYYLGKYNYTFATFTVQKKK